MKLGIKGWKDAEGPSSSKCVTSADTFPLPGDTAPSLLPAYGGGTTSDTRNRGEMCPASPLASAS